MPIFSSAERATFRRQLRRESHNVEYPIKLHYEKAVQALSDYKSGVEIKYKQEAGFFCTPFEILSGKLTKVVR